MSENEVDRKAAEELVRDLWAANKDTHYERVLIAAAFRAQARREGRREADSVLAGLIEAAEEVVERLKKIETEWEGEKYSLAALCDGIDSKHSEEYAYRLYKGLELRAEAAEAREAALMACLREARDSLKQLHPKYTLDERLGCPYCDLLKRIDALLAAQPRQKQAWKPYCVKCNRLMESILTCPFCGGHEASATQYLREHGADSPEAQEPGVRA